MRFGIHSGEENKMASRRRLEVFGGSVTIWQRGDPGEWAQHKRLWRRRDFLKPGAEKLDITGIKGCPGTDSYLSYLKRFEENPPGSETLLLSDQTKREFLASARADAQAEIKKYRSSLEQQERSVEAVSVYIVDLEKYIHSLRICMIVDPEAEPVEELRADNRHGNQMRGEFIVLSQEEIVRYKALLLTLK